MRGGGEGDAETDTGYSKFLEQFKSIIEAVREKFSNIQTEGPAAEPAVSEDTLKNMDKLIGLLGEELKKYAAPSPDMPEVAAAVEDGTESDAAPGSALGAAPGADTGGGRKKKSASKKSKRSKYYGGDFDLSTMAGPAFPSDGLDTPDKPLYGGRPAKKKPICPPKMRGGNDGSCGHFAVQRGGSLANMGGML